VFRLLGASLLVLSALFPAPWFAARADEARTALVIGNSRYSFAPLPNPEHDAADIADALRGSGFAVDLVLDASKAKMLASIGRFGDALTHRKGVGFFYYAGHGAQIAGENYLVPVDAAAGDELSLKQSAVSASLIVERQRPTTRSTFSFSMRAATIRSARPASMGCHASIQATGCSYPFPPSRQRSLSTGMTVTAPTPSTWRWQLQRPASIWRACSKEP
jgi:hypothetical protein